MNIRIITTEKISARFAKDAVNEYSKRLSRYCKVFLTEAKNESQVLKELTDRTFAILVNSQGESISSEALAGSISRLGVEGTSDIAFILAEDAGLTDGIRAKANLNISVSKLNMDMNILIIAVYEQIYRAFKIQNNETYHK